MPHDKNGNIIQVGDRVDIPCIVTQVTSDEGYCNVTVETTEVMPPENKYKNTYSLNAKQVEKVEI